MKKLAIILIVLLLVSGLGFAQEYGKVTHVDGMRIGMGISFGKEPMPETFMGLPMSLLDFPTFYLPVQLNSLFRIEPEFGYYQLKMKDGSDEDTFTIMCLGAGAFYTKWYGNCNIYLGARVQMWKWSEKSENGTTTTMDKTDLVISPAIGAEGYICKHLSFGGELQFNIATMGNWESDDSNGIDDESEMSLMKFKGLLFIRWWF